MNILKELGKNCCLENTWPLENHVSTSLPAVGSLALGTTRQNCKRCHEKLL